MNRPWIEVFQRETTRTEEGWFPAVVINEFDTGEMCCFIVHPEQQVVQMIAKQPSPEINGGWREMKSQQTAGPLPNKDARPTIATSRHQPNTPTPVNRG